MLITIVVMGLFIMGSAKANIIDDILVFFGFASAQSQPSQTLIDQDWGKDIYDNGDGTYTITLYSKLRNVKDENNDWVRIEDASSLMDTLNKGKIKLNYTYDGIHQTEIIDFNLTHIDLLLSFNKDALIGSEYEYEYEDGKFKTKIKYNDVEYEIEIQDDQQLLFSLDANPFEDAFHFGTESTVLFLQDEDIDNMDDTWVEQDSPNTIYGSSAFLYIHEYGDTIDNEIYMRWNITEVPQGMVIDDATMGYFINFNALDNVNEGWNTTVYRIYDNYTISGSAWTEEAMNWNNKPDASYLSDYSTEETYFGGSGEPYGEELFNLTQHIEEGYSEGALNVSFAFIGEDKFGNVGASDYVRWTAKEQTGFTQDPYLNITYSEPATTTTTTTTTPVTDTCTYGGSGDWEMDCSDNCLLQDGTTDISGELKLYNNGYVLMDNYVLTMNSMPYFYTNATSCEIIMNGTSEVII